ncbi:MAG: hypothetical protein M3O03_02435 [Pseudomonadota bacterium]|nr:hypothetical protein [Pseudomonadota bacterium]
MTDTTSPAPASKPKAPRERSPSYPAISLKAAIDRLERFEKTFGRHPAPLNKVGLAWGIKEGSSQAGSILAALKSFGLLDYAGAGSERVAQLSEQGRTYIRAQQDEIKKAVIKRAALKPKVMATFWPIWGADRPPDAVCLDQLVLKYDFNDNAAPIFLRIYDDTIAYAGLSNSDKVELPENEMPGEEEDGGLLDSSDDPPPPPPPSGKKEIKIMAGERELTTGLLAKDASFRLIVTGKIGAKEIDRLIAKLQLDKEILAEPDDTAEAEFRELLK